MKLIKSSILLWASGTYVIWLAGCSNATEIETLRHYPGGYVFFSGVTGCRSDGTVARDPEDQFRDAFSFLAETLAAGDLDWENMVEMTTYHVDLRKHLDAFIKVKDEFIAAPYPAWSCIGTTELIAKGTLVEIRVICQRPEND